MHHDPALAVNIVGGAGEIRGSMRGVCGVSDAGAVGEWNIAHRVAEEDDLAHSRNLSVVRIAKRNPEFVVHFGGGEGEVGARKGVTYN